MKNQFKDYELTQNFKVPNNMYAIIRLDGRAFHTFTKDKTLNLKRPYDMRFMDAMNEGAKMVIESVLPNALLTYVASDEVSILFKADGNTPFDRKMNKLLTLATSAMSVGFNKAIPTDTPALFDGRFAFIGPVDEIQDYFDWRRVDAWKNMISNAAYELYPSHELHGKSTGERLEMLVGTKYETMDNAAVWGRYITKERQIAYSIGWPTSGIERTVFCTEAATRATSDQRIKDIIDQHNRIKELEAILDEL